MKLIPTILCGGAGSRLWPLSRESHPKPFIRHPDGQSLLQKAWLRGAVLPNVTEMITVTDRELFLKSQDDYREIADSAPLNLPNSYILEPCGRHTAPAIAAAALQVAENHGEDALMLVLAADHLIADQSAFSEAVSQAAQLAQQGKLVTFGIQPEAPETGYGYIEANLNSPLPQAGEALGERVGKGERVNGVAGYSVIRFVEKPSLEKAQEYLESGSYLWNSGMFCFSAGSLLCEMEQHCPATLTAARICMAQSRKTEGKGFAQLELSLDTFDQIPEGSIDYAVMEKSRNVAVVPCNIGWCDIGSGSAMDDFIVRFKETRTLQMSQTAPAPPIAATLIDALPGTLLSTADASPEQQTHEVSIEMLSLYHAEHLLNVADSFGAGWLDRRKEVLRLQFHLVTIFSNAAADEFWLSIPGEEKKIALSPIRVGSPVAGQRHPQISWSAQSRFVVDEIIELPEWAMSSSKFELLAGVADKEMKIGVIYVAEASNDLKQLNTSSAQSLHEFADSSASAKLLRL